MDLQLVLVSFIAGVLTILAPCIFPLLPVLLGSSVDGKSGKKHAIVIVASLLFSISLVTILLHGATGLFDINQGVLRAISGVIILLLGASMVFPKGWEKISEKLNLNNSSNKYLAKAMSKDGYSRDVLIGLALGPVFSSCSPTYGLIIASILPVSFFEGLLYLLIYVFGLGLMFALIMIFGAKFVSKLGWATDPNGWFKRLLGVMFVIIAVAILFNLDKQFEEWLLNFDFYNSLVEFELNLR